MGQKADWAYKLGSRDSETNDSHDSHGESDFTETTWSSGSKGDYGFESDSETDYASNREKDNYDSDSDSEGQWSVDDGEYISGFSVGDLQPTVNNQAGKGYSFEIADGNVAAVYKIKDGIFQPESIDSDESWTVLGDDVVKVERDDDGVETTRYADTDGDGIYSKVFKSYSSADWKTENWGGSDDFLAGGTEITGSDYLFNW